eukprot:262868-Heterocapsa_arctica.AAC.1
MFANRVSASRGHPQGLSLPKSDSGRFMMQMRLTDTSKHQQLRQITQRITTKRKRITTWRKRITKWCSAAGPT